ncbi:MAG: hypothetical protein WKG32_03130 [Gemmatimonadaceae bacterium]
MRRLRLATLALGTLCVSSGRIASAQEGTLFERLNLDRLKLAAIGVSTGPVYPSRAEAARIYTVQADYGEITKRWRVVFLASYWGSNFTDAVVARFARQLERSVIDPSGDDTVRIGRIRVSDISLETDLRWTPRPHRVLRPYLGGGVGAHVINAESRFIENTFVESALDNIAAGLAAVAGLDIAPISAFTLGVQGRYTLVSNARFITARAGFSYFFNVSQPTP